MNKNVCFSRKLKVLISETVALGYSGLFWKKKSRNRQTCNISQVNCLLIGLFLFPFFVCIKRHMSSQKEKKNKRNGCKIKAQGWHSGDLVSVPGSVKHFLCDLVNVTFEHVKPSGLI